MLFWLCFCFAASVAVAVCANRGRPPGLRDRGGGSLPSPRIPELLSLRESEFQCKLKCPSCISSESVSTHCCNCKNVLEKTMPTVHGGQAVCHSSAALARK